MRQILIFAGAICLITLGLSYWHINERVTKFELPEGELKWSNKRPKNAKMCIPAAFTDVNGRIMGAYRCGGRSAQSGKTLKMKISLKGGTFFMSTKWLSNNGFQQLTLVNNSRAIRFLDSRKRIRRALCKTKKETFILESNYPMTLSDFAYYCSKRCQYAVYLDMGEYGYGYIKNNFLIRPLYIWGIFTQYKQTNWLYVE